MKKRTPATPVPSLETQTEAMKIAKATQKPGQTKEQTKLIAQGIEKASLNTKNSKKSEIVKQIKQRKNSSVKNCASMKKMLSSQITSRMMRQTTPQVSCLGRY